MRQPIYLAGHAHVSACGSGVAAAEFALHESPRVGVRALGSESRPYFWLPYEGDWAQRTDRALSACWQALEHSRKKLTPLAADSKADTAPAVFLGSSSFQLGATEAHLSKLSAEGASLPRAQDLPPELVSPYAFAKQMMRAWGLRSVPWLFSSACTSALLALTSAIDYLESGASDHAWIAATELDNQLSASGFHALGLLSPTRPQPLSATRDGLVLGEAVCALRLQTFKPEGLPESDSVWRLLACEMCLDSHSLTGIDPSGAVVAQVMRRALQTAGLMPKQIDLVKIHAAGVDGTDLAEARGLQTVFADAMPPLLSLKPWLGHTQGASGVVELALLLDCLAMGEIPGHPEPNVDPDIGLVLNPRNMAVTPQHVMLNSIGFGGNVACLILAREPS